MSKLSQDHVGLEENKKDYEKRLNRQEKVWKNELSVYRFKLEAETRYFTEELGRLQKRLECETTDYSSLKGQMNVKEDECQRLKALLENSQKYCKELKLEQEKDSLAVSISIVMETWRGVWWAGECGGVVGWGRHIAKSNHN